MRRETCAIINIFLGKSVNLYMSHMLHGAVTNTFVISRKYFVQNFFHKNNAILARHLC